MTFALPIFSQWFAAQSLQSGSPTIDQLVSDPRRLDRWKYPIAIAIATGTTSFVDELVGVLAHRDAGFAADVLNESLSRWASEAPRPQPDSLAAGGELRRALLAWGAGVAPLDGLLLPHDSDGEVLPLAVDARPGWLWTGWHDGSENRNDVVLFKPGVKYMSEDTPGWRVQRGGRWSADKGWAWNWSLDQLRHTLTALVKAKELRVDDRGLVDEALWLFALKATRLGSLSEVPMQLEPLRENLANIPPNSLIQLDNRWAYADQLVARADELLTAGTSVLLPPWPSSDLDIRGGWIWNPYSDQRQLERVRAVYTAAISAYLAIVDRWFVGLRSRMLTAAFLPARFVGEFHANRGKDWSHQPMLNWHWEPLPADSQSLVAISVRPEKTEQKDYADVLDEYDAAHLRLLQLRPEASAWISTTYTWGAADVFHATPVAEISYKWIESDLKRINWLD
jgi:hypothetical protein